MSKSLVIKLTNISLVLKHVFSNHDDILNINNNFIFEIVELILRNFYELSFPVISCGTNHTIVMISGVIFGCGRNDRKQLNPLLTRINSSILYVTPLINSLLLFVDLVNTYDLLNLTKIPIDIRASMEHMGIISNKRYFY